MGAKIEISKPLNKGLREDLRKAICSGNDGDIEVDASDSQAIGGLGVQLLLAAKRDSIARGTGFKIKASRDLMDEFIRLGVSSELISHGNNQ